MATPIRVAQVVGRMMGGGVESVVMNYYRRIDRDRVQFDFIISSDSTCVPEEEMLSLGARIFRVPPCLDVLKNARELEALFSSERWSIVHSHINTLSALSLRAAKRAGVPVRIAHSHSAGTGSERLRSAAKYVLRTQANRYPTHRVACGSRAGRWQFGPREEFRLIRNAIELDQFAFNDQVRQECRAELGINSEALVLGHIGRFEKVKNHKYLLGVFSEVLERQPNSVLLLAGDGELRESVQRQASQLGIEDKVLSLGQYAAAWRLYQAFDFFLLPSFYEGMPLVGIEAQRSGLPCLFSNRVSKEAAITDRCAFLPIDVTPSFWADEIMARSLQVDRALGLEEASRFDEYDIVHAAERLAEWYLELEEGV